MKKLIYLLITLIFCLLTPTTNWTMHLNKFVKQNNIEAIKIALFQNKRSPHEQDKYGNTPHINATKKNSKQIAYLLIESGAHINDQGKNGDTALHWAAFLNHRTIAQHLIERGAALFLQNALGDTPFMDAATKKNRNLIKMMLITSYFPARESLAEFLLEQEEEKVPKLTLLTLQRIGLNPQWLLQSNLEIPEPLPQKCFDAIAHESSLSAQRQWIKNLHSQTMHNPSCICLMLMKALCVRHIKFLKKTLEVKNIFQKTAYDIARENDDEPTAELLNPETLQEKIKEDIEKIYKVRLAIEENQGPAQNRPS